jgi:hypothetical protein
MTPEKDARDQTAGTAPRRHGGADTGEEHDLGLIAERLAWSPARRLDANTAFLRFYLLIRPGGPLIDGDR